ncbi:MAG: cyclic lactone autoinducer peptide [Acidaminobacteraceae bacterium]
MKKNFLANKIEKIATYSAEKSVNKCLIVILEEPKMPKALLKKNK